MGILTGPNAVPGNTNAFELAISEINAAGGINGRKIEFKKFDTNITPEATARATSLALQYKPSVFIGFSVSAGLKASINSINAAGIPVIHGTLAKLTSPASLGSKLTFRMGPTTSQYASAADSYLFGQLGVKKLTVIHTEDSAPTEGAKAIATDAGAKGVSVVERGVAPTATDLTEPVLAAKGSDAIWTWGYATTDALTVKQAAQNKVDVPIMTFSVGNAARVGLIPPSLLTDKITSVSSCAPYAVKSDGAVKFMAAYQAKYGTQITDALEPRWYDAVYLFKNAVLKAGSANPAKVAEALKSASFDGVCGPEKADANNNLLHNVPIVKWTGTKPTLVVNQQDVTSAF
jgi:branched-chain amino acid transport system substrate-binding protein